jgi:ArsR family transcriptional regulator
MTATTGRVHLLAPGRGPARAPDCADAVALLQAIADPVRMSVMRRLGRSTACVCTIQEDLPIAANLLSYHLKVLREAGLVTTTRRGRWIDYTLAPDALDRLHAAIPDPASVTDDHECATAIGSPAPQTASPATQGQ